MSATQHHIVRVPRGRKKKYGVVKFATGTDIDFVKLSQTPVKIERENNLKDYKLANDLDTQPKFGAGSEFGRDLKEEARRKKYGKIMKHYNPDDQPWQLKIGSGKQVKRYKGVREGTISDNTSYYIFMQGADGAFEAVPIEEWYNFQNIPKYKYLNSDEAEEEFTRRDKTLNMFSIMLKKRINKGGEEDKDLDLEEGEKKTKKKGKEKDFKLTDMDDWAEKSDDEDEEDEDEEDGDKEEKKEAKAKKNKKKKEDGKKGKKNAKHNSDDEAVEESDEGDYDDREVDYISDSDSLSEPDEQTKEEKYNDKGVEEEHGLRKLIDSEESSEDENKEEEAEEDKDKPEKDKKDAGSDSDSSSSSSASDSDIEKEEKINSALFMQKSSDKKRSSPLTVGDKQSSSRSGTPTNIDDRKGLKRKLDGDMSSGKKPRTESPVFNSQSGTSLDGITEESIRRYLTRKPMTAKELVLKFKSKKLNMSSEQMTSTIAQLLRKINPDKSTINNTMYLSLKKPE
ncbi:hypothetical protein ScPMuIL_006235 [Solemya velum]